VLVSGFLGPRGAKAYWGTAHDISEARVLQVDPSPVGSLHDRACEIFYQLKGGVVDYGSAHGTKFGHGQFGDRHEHGLFPEWDESNPIHLVGHSYGGNTIRVLQQFLADGLFPGHATSAGWIVSITAINTPLNGAEMVYALGAQRPDGESVSRGHCDWSVRRFSPGFLLGVVVHVWEFLDLRWAKRCMPLADLGLDHWQASWRHGWRAAFELWWVLRGGKMCADKDNAAHDLTVHAMANLNARLQTFPATYYLSYVGNIAPSSCKNGCCVQRSRVQNSRTAAQCSAYETAVGFLLWVLIGLFRIVFFGSLRMDRFLYQSAKYEWDGVCATSSQREPVVAYDQCCGSVPSVLSTCAAASCSLTWKNSLPPGGEHRHCRPGKWYTQEMFECDHLGVVPFPKSKPRQLQFFQELFALQLEFEG
jgi:hypothetical protein